MSRKLLSRGLLSLVVFAVTFSAAYAQGKAASIAR
jgi:hypothetical protein